MSDTEAQGWFPEGYGQDTADAICERLADGESLRSICRDEQMPSTSTVCKWLSKNAAFAEQYTRARELQADALFDDILEIADDGRNDWMEREGEGNEGWRENGEALRRSHLRIEARKWMAGKLKGKYSDKLTVNNNTTVTHRYDLDNLPDAELDQLERILAHARTSAGGESASEPSQLH